MQHAEWLAVLNLLVAFIGVMFVGFTVFEWTRLRTLRKNMTELESRTDIKIHFALKATHRILASYTVSDAQARAAMLEEAVKIDPSAFNGYNALGYAYLEIGDSPKALDSFVQAIVHHPDDKAGYCDLAWAHVKAGNDDLAVKYFKLAINADPTARLDIVNDTRIEHLLSRIV